MWGAKISISSPTMSPKKSRNAGSLFSVAESEDFYEIVKPRGVRGERGGGEQGSHISLILQQETK